MKILSFLYFLASPTYHWITNQENYDNLGRIRNFGNIKLAVLVLLYSQFIHLKQCSCPMPNHFPEYHS